MTKKVTKRQAARIKGYRSGLEEDVDKHLIDRGVNGEYEHTR